MSMTETELPTLTFEQFWAWMKLHHNCIVRAGAAGFALFDDHDLHWHLTETRDGLCVVQLVRGKNLLGELTFPAADVLYVQATPEEEEHMLFECVGAAEEGHLTLCWFLMAHAYDEVVDAPGPSSLIH